MKNGAAYRNTKRVQDNEKRVPESEHHQTNVFNRA